MDSANCEQKSVNSPFCRNKKGQFVSKSKKRWLDNLAESCVKRKRPRYVYNSALKGSRIIELDTLAEELWCTKCNIGLSLRDTISETRHCLASTLEVVCRMCNTRYKVNTCKPYNENKQYKYPINGKMVLGMYDIGIGPCKLNDLLSCVDIPTINPALLKKYEDEMGHIIDECANESFRNAIEAEKLATITASKAAESNQREGSEENESNSDTIDLIASFDAGWQKRGSGFSRNSLSGHASLFGYHTGLLLGVSTKSKSCSGCNRGRSADKHSCNRNWTGSSKGMEPAMGVELIANNHLMQQLSVRVTTLIADDDAATISNVQKNVSWKIEKWSDINHMKKNFTSQLYSLKTPAAVIKYFSRRLMLIIQSNRNNPEAIKELLLSAVEHAYGNHEDCGLWCGYVQDPQTYKYSNLPGKKPLSDSSRRKPINDIFKKIAENVLKIAPCGSTQRNESFNHTVAVCHPKNLFYASTSSFPSRVKVAALKTNEKSSYIHKIYEKVGFISSSYSIDYRQAKDEVAAARSKQLQNPEERRRRNKRKLRRSQADSICENREGISYDSGCGRFDFSSLGLALDDTNVQHIPTGKEIIVIFDLETTGLSDNTEICQIAAAVHEDEIFNAYIVPLFGISKRASLITGLTVHDTNLYYHGELVEAISAKEALVSFISFLKSVSGDNKVILAAHNCFRFDAFVLLNHLLKYQLLEEFQSVVTMFADTLVAIQKHLPGRRKEKKSYALDTLTAEFIGAEALTNSHNAITDVDNLLKIVNQFNVQSLVAQCSQSIHSILTKKSKAAQINILKNTLDPLNVSLQMKKRVASAGISLQILLDIFKRDGESGIRFCLSESVNGKPRITKNRQIIEKFIEDIQKLTTDEDNNNNNNDMNNTSNNERYECILNSDDDADDDDIDNDNNDSDNNDGGEDDNDDNIFDESINEDTPHYWDEEAAMCEDEMDVYNSLK